MPTPTSRDRDQWPIQPGIHVGPYEILSAIGAGGMGEVYRARDPKLDRDVAIKVLPEAFARDIELNSHEIRLEFREPLFTGPQVERDGRDFVHHGHSQSGFCDIHRLDIGPAGLTGLDAHVLPFLRNVDGQMSLARLAARRAKDAAVAP